MKTEGGSTAPSLDGEMYAFSAHIHRPTLRHEVRKDSYDLIPFMHNALDLSPNGTNMSGDVRKGERIPRRDPPPYEEADSFGQGVSRDGFFSTAINDTNQYGPIGMMILLFIVATITGAAIKLLESL